MLASRPGSLQRIFGVMGLVLLAYGFNEWRQIKPLSEAEVMQQVEIRYLLELARLKKNYGPDYTEDASWTTKRLQAIQNEVTAPYEHRRKRAVSIMFGGGALLFVTASGMFSMWLYQRLNPEKPQLKA